MQWYTVTVTLHFPGDSKLLLVPRSGTIFGGTPVRIFGPCAQNPKDIKCIFDNKEVDGEYNPDNGQFMCVTPRFQEMGRINFTLQFTTASGEKVVYSSLFSVGKTYTVFCICYCLHIVTLVHKNCFVLACYSFVT